MGWSCTVKADNTMNAIFNLESELDRLIHYNGERFFCESSDTEYDDGRIRMSVMKIIDEKDGRYKAEKLGTFSISPNGDISTRARNKFPFLSAIFK